MQNNIRLGKLTSNTYKYLFWLFLALPAFGIIDTLINEPNTNKAIEQAIHGSGELGSRWMLLALMITPLNIWLKGWRGPRFLMRHRRNIGVAAFLYMVAHLVFYLIGESNLSKILNDFSKFHILMGWLSFFLIAPVAISSMDYAQRKLGFRRWKSIQRLCYSAAGLTLLHWMSLDDWNTIAPAAIQYTPLILLTTYRIKKTKFSF